MRVTTPARDRESLPPLFQIWDDSLPKILPAGQSLVLAETVNFNFDTSDVGEFTVNNPPVVSGSLNGASFSFTDQGFVLLGRGDAVNTPETTRYQQLGVAQPPNFMGGTVLGLGAVQAECQDLSTNQVVRGSIVNGTLNCVALGLQSQPGDRVAVRLRGLAFSGGQLPAIIAKDKTTVSCTDMKGMVKDWVIETTFEAGKCSITVNQGSATNPQGGGNDLGGMCDDGKGNTVTGVDCSRNGGKGGCVTSQTKSTEGQGSCTPQ